MKALAINLCNNVLIRGEREDIPISPMKLQRLLYYICRDYAQKTGVSPIYEQFHVWQCGPVLLSVYGKFKVFGENPITVFARDAAGTARKVSERDNPILSETLDLVWTKYKHKTGIELSQMTHQKGSGWYRAYMESRDTITLEDMKNDKSK